MSFATYNRLNVHMTATPREVIRAARNKIKPNAQRAPDFRDARHDFYRDMLEYHDRAAHLYSTMINRHMEGKRK